MNAVLESYKTYLDTLKTLDPKDALDDGVTVQEEIDRVERHIKKLETKP